MASLTASCPRIPGAMDLMSFGYASAPAAMLLIIASSSFVTWTWLGSFPTTSM